MTTTEKGGFEVNVTLSKDNYKLNAQSKDLTEFCKLLNDFFADLAKRGFITLKDITPAMMNAVAQFDAAPIIEAIIKAYTDEAAKIKYERARLDFLKSKENAVNEIKTAIENTHRLYERNALRYYKPKEGGYWRLRYLQVENGFVSFNRDLLISDCTNSVRSKEQEEFIKRANDLYTQLLEFEKECKRLSGGEVHGIAFVYGGDAIITIGEFGDIIFDASYTSQMRFDKDL